MNKLLPVICLLFFINISCKHTRYNVDVSHVDIDIKVNHFYKDLFSADTSDIKELAIDFSTRYGRYWDIYNYGVIKTGDPSLKDFPVYLGKFLCNSSVRELADSCFKVFSDVKDIEKELTGAFKHVKHYFPKKNIPEIYFHISGFNQSVVVDSGFVSVSVDNYLGGNSKYYKSLLVPMYLRKKMQKNRISKDVVLAYAMSEFQFRPQKINLLSNMIYQGKIRCFLKAMMPELPENEIMGYTNDQMEWCQKNEAMIWEFFVKNKYLFSSDYKIIMRYINDGPFTSGMPKDSPGLVAVWLGMKIVNSYVEENNCSVNSLMEENDYIGILRKSAYQP